MNERRPIDRYLAEFRRGLTGIRWWNRRGLIAEARDHLEDAALHERESGFGAVEAEQRAVDRFGDPLELARQSRAVHAVSWRRRAGVIGVLAAAIAIVVVVVSLQVRSPAGPPRIIRVEQVTVNLGNRHYRIVAAASPNRFQVPLSELARWLPRRPPAPLKQNGPCPDKHLLITFTLSDGTAIHYGPCQIPPPVGVVRHNLALAYGRSRIALKLERLRLEAVQRQIVALPVQPRTYAALPLRITGGTAAQRQLLHRLIQRIPRRVWPAESITITPSTGRPGQVLVTSGSPTTSWPPRQPPGDLAADDSTMGGGDRPARLQLGRARQRPASAPTPVRHPHGRRD